MKAIILNSGLGSRMGALTAKQPKCMTSLREGETILSRQLLQLQTAGIQEVVITTGAFAEVLREYCACLALSIRVSFVHNPIFRETNYIYSIACAKELVEDDDVLLLHGDLVWKPSVLTDVLSSSTSCMCVSSTKALPEKDFKAVVTGGKIRAVGIEFFEDAVAAQPLYYLKKKDWQIWLEAIAAYCASGEEKKRKCYAENAFNEVSEQCDLRPLDVGNRLCAEVDNEEDLSNVRAQLARLEV